MLPYLAAFASALLMWAAFPPLDVGPLAFVAPIPLFWALRRVERGFEAVTIGFLWGTVFFGLLLFWISILGFIAWVPLVLLMAAYFAALRSGGMALPPLARVEMVADRHRVVGCRSSSFAPDSRSVDSRGAASGTQPAGSRRFSEAFSSLDRPVGPCWRWRSPRRLRC